MVVEPGIRSIETASNIARMAKELGIKKVAAVANKITESSQVEIINSQLTNITVIASLKYSSLIQEADLKRRSVFAAVPELVSTLKSAKDKLLDLIESDAVSL